MTNAQVKTWSSPSVLLAREPAETVVEVPVAEAPPLVPAAEEMRGQIFEWLQDSFEGLNAQLRVLADNLSRQQQALAEVSDSHAAAGRLSQLADALPERIGAAVQEAVTAGGRSVAAVEHEADTVDLRGSADAERGDQRELPESSPAAAVWSSQVDELVDELVGANVGPPAGAPDSPSPTGVRTQLTSLASTVHTRINRSGWQEKLRSLSSR